MCARKSLFCAIVRARDKPECALRMDRFLQARGKFEKIREAREWGVFFLFVSGSLRGRRSWHSRASVRQEAAFVFSFGLTRSIFEFRIWRIDVRRFVFFNCGLIVDFYVFEFECRVRFVAN